MFALVVFLVYAGSALMAFDIYSFVRFARTVRQRENLGSELGFLYLPIVLLVLFFVGYLVVGVFGDPDLLVAGIFFGGSVFVYLVYQMIDRITQRTIEHERQEAKLLASKQSNEAKSRFLANMSHEMRSPLNIILGLNKLALGDSTLSDQTRDKLGRIDLSARHLLQLINNILDMNRLSASTFMIKDEEFFVREDVVDQVSALAGTLCDEKGLDYSLRVGESVAWSMRGDSLQIKQVLLCLLDNAIKYTDAPGTVGLVVEAVSLEGSTQVVRMSVSDTGVGIDEEFVPHLFDAFAQEDESTTSRFGGGGLSLAVAKGSVELMGGSIKATSRKGEGSLFVVTLPLEVAELKMPREEVEDEALVVEGELLDGKRILIVEDMDDNAEIVADLLDLEGAESERAKNGQIAVRMFAASASNYYDAVLMDLRMPVMDGLEATRSIRSLLRDDAKNVPIIALSANSFKSDIDQCLAVGMNAHLAKPADADELYDTIRRLCGMGVGNNAKRGELA